MKEKLKGFLSTTLLIEFSDAINDETDLFQSGLIDSFGYVQLVAFIESEFNFKITDEELLSDALASLANMHRYIVGKTDLSWKAA